MCSVLQIIKTLLKSFANHLNHLTSWFFKLQLKHQFLFASSICVASVILCDFSYGFKSHLQTNAAIKKRIVQYNRRTYNPNLQKSKASHSNQSNLTVICNDKSPLFLRNQLNVKDWLSYFYKTRLNAYVNVFLRCVDVYIINKSYRVTANEWMLGKFLTEAPSMLTVIDPPNLERHNYALNKLNIRQVDDIIFFSDQNFYLPFHGKRQLVELIEVCCKIIDNNSVCLPIYWRIKTDKLGHLDKKDISIEEFMSFVVPWVSTQPHTKLHSYAANIILKNNNNIKNDIKLIQQDLKTAETSMIALNHVGKTAGTCLGWTMEYTENILTLHTLNPIWEHGYIIKAKLNNFRVPKFLILARNKLQQLFLENKLFGIYNFEATFLCIVCHGLDHYAVNIWKYCHLRSNEKMGPDMMAVVTMFTIQNKPIIREARLKYLAKSKMFKHFAEYLESIDPQLANAVHLINSG